MSCICPTKASRAKYLPTAIQCFQAQTYPNRELLILQDGAGEDLARFATEPNVRFLRYPGERPIGPKRNLCCELARGSVIAHWDDDDWSYPGRLEEQISAIRAGAPVVGYRTIHFIDERTGRCHEYHGSRDYIVGTSMCYTREWWQAHRFRELGCGEDNDFRDRARRMLSAFEGLGKMVALTHSGGTSPRSINNMQWRAVEPSALPWRPA